MPKPSWRSEVQLTADIDAAEQPAAAEQSDDRPFIIVVLGDFRGSADG